MRLGRIGYVNCYPVYGAVDRGIVALDATLVTNNTREFERVTGLRLENWAG